MGGVQKVLEPLLWRARRQRNAWLRDGFGRAVHVGAWVSVVLLAVSIVANVIGNVSLAEMLNSGVIDSGYFGLVLYAGMTVIVALLRLLLARGGQARLRVVREHATPLLSRARQRVTRSKRSCAPRRPPWA